jgi:hypothetical protein
VEQTTPVIRLVKHKQWYIPADAQDYQILVNLGIPSTRIHEDQREIVKHVAERKGYTLRGKHFETVLEEFTEDLYKRWMRFPHRNVKFKKSSMIFSTTDAAAFKRARDKSVPLLTTKLQEFFQRWGFVGDFKYSENHDKVRLVVDYNFSSFRKPVITLKENPKEVTKSVINLGGNRLIFWREDKHLHWEIETKAANEWRPRVKGSCLHSEMSDPTDSIILLMRSLDETDLSPDKSFDKQIAAAFAERDAAVAEKLRLQEDLAKAKERIERLRKPNETTNHPGTDV